MNYADMRWNEDGLPKAFYEGQKVENIQVSGKGTIDVYISPEQEPEKASNEQSLKILSIEADGFPVGYPEVLSACKSYAFSYVFSGTGEFSCISSEAFQKYEPAAGKNGIEELPVVQCLTLIDALYRSFNDLIEFNREMHQFINCTSAFYWFLKDAYSIGRNPKTEILHQGIDYYRKLKSNGLCLSEFSPDGFDECLSSIAPETESEYDLHTGKYISALINIPEGLLQSFLGEDFELPLYHLIEASKELIRFREYFKKEFGISKKLFLSIFSNTEESIISELLRALVEIRQGNNDITGLVDFINFVCERFKGYIELFEEKYGYSVELNLNKLNLLLANLKSGNGSAAGEASVKDNILQKLDGSLDRILEFSCIDTEKKDFFKNFIEHFKEARPKTEHIPIEIKRKVNAVFFEIYEAVISRIIEEDPHCPAIDMFLLYGFTDSALLTPQQIDGLYGLMEQFASEPNIYTMKSWLIQVGAGEKIPSVNELGVTYAQVLKEMRQSQKSDQPGHMIHFEIMNMLRTGHRVSSGHTSSYLAFLHNDMLPDDIGKFAMTSKKIGDALREILNIDYSAFHREVFYSGENEILKKEIIMKQVIPDIILLPVMGTRALMWQELSTASRSSPGRWIIPIISSENITSMLIKLTGQYRWELCRSIMGPRWNDVSYNSLTAVYAEYIESYKKNKNLTPEAKERLRTQIKRYQNNLRNIFTADYEMWLKHEYGGIRRLNKEVRSIFYRFCPFPAQKRKELINQPAFSDIAVRYENERMKISREIESRYAQYVKKGCVLDEELVENLRFYKEM